MFNLKFYYCTHCGNIAVKAVDQGPKLICCGDTMVELEANTTDAAVEKHVPALTVEGATAKVAVGEAEHPMEQDHYIQFICLSTNIGVHTKMLSPGDKPEAVFALADGEEPYEVFEHCNKHGLWKAQD